MSALGQKQTIFQRTAQWMFPNPNYHAKVGPGVRWALRHLPFYGRWYRFLIFWPGCDSGLAAAKVDPEWPDQQRAVSAANARPNPAWLNFVRTGRARSKIRHYLKTMEQEESQDLGEKMLAQALRAEGLQLPDEREEYAPLWQQVTRWSGNRNRGELLVDIGLGRKIAIIGETSGYSVASVKSINGKLAAVGITPVSSAVVDANKTDLTDEITKAEKDEDYRMVMSSHAIAHMKMAKTKKKGARYTPVARRQDKPEAIAFILKKIGRAHV